MTTKGEVRIFFPRRFFPFGDHIPRWLHRILNRYLGTLIYAQLRKPH